MEKVQVMYELEEFRLTAPPDQLGELFMEAVLEDMAQPHAKRPLQCVTVKMPLPEYLRMKRATQKWNMTYTDVINFCTQRVIPILESPSGRVAQKLEQHRLDSESRRALRAGRSKS
ncbi:hypothetical protein [Granulicella tundricola]|uniref:Uncharacterized protein n=1 Tax=Granulicella tundricola (strain ATCC BAA-1859 / DSM 23138 / MP5ACTX9) TaxID=1198114 RepID=E8X7K3_GRATM|nr:hypothetical protein [Granulicella tundricola]ADW71437.1 hypothetical protein AciX9_4492 [Granulicella tundricola MP5ACTX9]